MRHTLQAEGFGVRLRPVQMDDAAFIVWLRNQDYVKGRVGDSAPDTAGQQKWLEACFQRNDDYYFIVETPGGIPLGTHGLYDISGKKAEWGRFVMRLEVPAAVPGSILIYDLAFGRLNLQELLARCVSTNLPMLSLSRKFGFRQTEVVPGSQKIDGKPVDMVHFVLQAADWPECRKRLLAPAQFAESRIREWEKQAFDRPAGSGAIQ